MKAIDQCPSSVGKDRPASVSGAAGRASSGPRLWRSLEEFYHDPQFEAMAQREFPAGASEIGEETRRDFLKIMGASLALAGAAAIPGCRRPDHKIMPYSRDVPEETIPGQPLFFATAWARPGGGAEGLLVETHEGRPTKIEGNPLHPLNRGKSSAWAQASILGMYDPDRLKWPTFQGRGGGGPSDPNWGNFVAWARETLAKFDADRGRGLAFIVDKKRSPSRDAMRDRILSKWPEATWVAWDAVETDGAKRGTSVAFGAPMRRICDLSKARVIVSIDDDFTCSGPTSLADARSLAATRRVEKSTDTMSRLYVVETAYTGTGASADHRVRLAPSRIPAFAVALARAVLARVGGDAELRAALESIVDPEPDAFNDLPRNESYSGTFIEAVADDLVEHRREAVILVGASQPSQIHALMAAVNAALGSAGTVVGYLRMDSQDGRREESSSPSEQLRALAGRMRAGEIDTLVCVHTNPLYDAPGDLDFADAFGHVPNTVTLSVESTETAAASTWSLDGAHYLEQWGDVEASDGTISPVQPMIAPLYGSRSDLEFYAILLGEDHPNGYEIVRGVWQKQLGVEGEAFEKVWKRSLHDGVLANTTQRAVAPVVDAREVAGHLRTLTLHASPTRGSMDVAFFPGKMYDGRFANCGWLQELPEMATRVAWQGPACVSPATAEALGLEPEGDTKNVFTHKEPKGRNVTITVGGRSVQMPLWVMPGMPDDTILLPLGYGRTVCGHVGTGVGVNVSAVRESGSPAWLRGATIAAATGSTLIPCTQAHWTMEGRTGVFRSMDLKWWKHYAAEFEALPNQRHVKRDPMYTDKAEELNLAEMMDASVRSHSPPNYGIYDNPFNKGAGSDGRFDAEPGSVYSQRPQWGMTIDLSTCTGCGVCTIACQAENNIPIVGPREVAKGREMAWIRVDRYYVSDVVTGTGHDLNDPSAMLHQPVACVQCENAPCETVCPVNATVHGPEGINYMVYNRCIGTRYCANNCPYKVRRFNFFDYAPAKYNGTYIGQGILPQAGQRNANLVPPRLREKVNEIQKMQMNPDVTVRSRGVMEKCTYCIQRINQARVESRLKGLDHIPDGFFQVACQQACPSDAISFGDLLDPAAGVRSLRHSQRSYLLLGFINTRPRTSHLISVRNPNEKLIARSRVEFDPLEHFSHGGGHEGDGHAYVEPAKRATDAGYAMSLKVLALSNGGLA